MNNIQEDPRDTPYLSPRTLPPSYTPIYEPEADPTEVAPSPDFQSHSPPPSPLNEPSLTSTLLASLGESSPNSFSPPSFPNPSPLICYSFIDPSDLRIGTLLSLFFPEHRDPIPPCCYTLGPGPIYLSDLLSFLNVALPNIIIPCFTEYPLAILIEFLWRKYPLQSNFLYT